MLRIGQQEGICEVRPDVCPMNIAQVCGCDAQTYSNACIAASNGVNVMTEGACQTEAPTTISPTSTPVEPNENKAAYCSLSSRDDDCWIEGWPQCCMVEDQPCPPDRVPRCDNRSGDGWDYCTWSPDKDCYDNNGWPDCCGRFQGTNCPENQVSIVCRLRHTAIYTTAKSDFDI